MRARATLRNIWIRPAGISCQRMELGCRLGLNSQNISRASASSSSSVRSLTRRCTSASTAARASSSVTPQTLPHQYTRRSNHAAGATLSSLTRFTVTADWTPTSALGTLSGIVFFQMLITEGNALVAPTLTTPGIVVPVVEQGRINAGVLVGLDGNPVELVANTAVLGLSTPLYYQVSYESMVYTYSGSSAATQKITLENFIFEAPTSATTIDLSSVAPAAGVAAGQNVTTTSTNISDATTIGREVLTAASQSAAQTLLGLAPPSAGMVKSTGTALTGAVPGVDYERPFWFNVLNYGADPTNVADSTEAFERAQAALQTATYIYPDLPSGGGRVYMPTGTYLIESSLDYTQLQNLEGDGNYLSILNYTGTGPCINAANTNAPTGWPIPCNFKGFTIDGSNNANAGSGGLQIGNLDNSIGHDIHVQNFHQTGSFGVAWQNYLPGSWSSSNPFVNLPAAERMRWTKISIRNCTNAYIFDGGGVAQSQFNFGTFELEVFASTNQNGITFRNDALMGGTKLSLKGNFSAGGGGSNTGYVLGFDVGNPSGVSTIGAGSTLDVIVECDAALGTPGHTPLILASTNFGGISASGTLYFVPTVSGWGTWQASSISYAATFAMSPYVSEPSLLGTMSGNDSANFQGGTQRNAFDNGFATIPSSYTIHPQYGDVQDLLLPNTACAITGFFGEPFNTSRSIRVRFHQPASGASCAVTVPGNVIWKNGYSTFNTANSSTTEVEFTYYPYNQVWHAEVVGTNPTTALNALYLNHGLLPADNGYGWKYWAYDPLYAYTGAIPAAGFANFTLLDPVRVNDTITNVVMDVQTAGATLTSGQCFAALFNAAGTLLSATANQSTNWQSTGLKTMALSAAQAVTPGLYYAGFFWNGTTGPKFSTSGVQSALNGANSGTYPRFGIDVGHTGLTTAFPSAASVTAAGSGYWAAAS